MRLLPQVGMTPGCTWLPILLIKVRTCTNGSIVLIWVSVVWAKGVHSSKGLDADKIYYVRLYALNSAGEDWTGKRISSQVANACKSFTDWSWNVA